MTSDGLPHQVRMQRYDFDESALKPYLSLPGMQRALFDTAGKLFGVHFVKVDLEAKGMLKRDAASKPMRWYRA